MSTNVHFELLAKLGYAARGIVFILVASLALFSGIAGAKADMKSALAALLEQPFGRLWVATIGLCLLGFVAWRAAQSFGDSDGHGRSGKAIIQGSVPRREPAVPAALALPRGHGIRHARGTAGSPLFPRGHIWTLAFSPMSGFELVTAAAAILM
jgi:hypothetical protein